MTDTLRSSAAETLYAQPVQKSYRYGTKQGSNVLMLAGDYVDQLAIYTNTDGFLVGIRLSLATKYAGVFQTTTTGITTGGGIQVNTVELNKDCITSLAVCERETGGVTAIGGLHYSTLRGTNTYTHNSSVVGDFRNVEGHDGLPLPTNLVLAGLEVTFDDDLDVITSIKFYYRVDVYRYQAVYDIIYDQWSVPQLRTTEGISTGSAQNLTNTDQEFSLNFEEEMVTSVEFSFTAGIASETTAEINASLFTLAGGSVEEKVTISASLTVGGGISLSKKFSQTATVTVPPSTIANARVTIQQYYSTADFTATVADVYAHCGAIERTATGSALAVNSFDTIISFEEVAVVST